MCALFAGKQLIHTMLKEIIVVLGCHIILGITIGLVAMCQKNIYLIAVRPELVKTVATKETL